MTPGRWIRGVTVAAAVAAATALAAAPLEAQADALEYSDYRTEPFLAEEDAFGMADTTRPAEGNLFYLVWLDVPGWDAEGGGDSAFDLTPWAMANVRVIDPEGGEHVPTRSLVRAPYGLHLFFELPDSPDVAAWTVAIGEREPVPLGPPR